MLKDRESTGGSPVSGGDLGTAAGCAGCGGSIKDRFYLLAVDRQWHSACLKCCECKLPLDSELTCFARANNIYCKEDYYRLFAVKRCARCQAGISARELVMRARDFVYHVHCFTCAHCQRPLSRGDHFGMRDGLVFCRSHYEELQLYSATSSPHPPLGHHPLHPLHQGIECCGEEEELADITARSHGVDMQAESPGRAGSGGNAALSPGFFNGTNSGQKGRPRKRKVPESDLQNVGLRIPPVLEMLHPGELAGPLEQLAFDSSSASSPGNPSGTGSLNSQQAGQRTKRMRTSFKHHQLRTMKSYFAINQNPDAKDLKQLAQKTGLSKRVLQVWFQNARAKWRRNIMRQENHQQPGVNTGQMDNSGVMTPIPGSGPPSHLQSGDSLSMQSAPPPLLVDDNSAQNLAFSDLY